MHSHCDPHCNTTRPLCSRSEGALSKRTLMSISTTAHANASTALPHKKSSELPFGVDLSAAEISWIIFGAALVVMLLLCLLICAGYCLCKQRIKRAADKRYVSMSQ